MASPGSPRSKQAILTLVCTVRTATYTPASYLTCRMKSRSLRKNSINVTGMTMT